jgi:hypothetical protein
VHSPLIAATLTSALLITLAAAGRTRPAPASSTATPAAEPQPTAPAAPAVAPAPAATWFPVDPPSAPPPSTSPTRVAILNFGPPSSWGGQIDDTVGIEVTAEAWRQAADLLQRDGVQVVVVRVNAGGGFYPEISRFHKVFREQYVPRFRTIAWIESAYATGAMSVYAIPEFYFLPGGVYGNCTLANPCLGDAPATSLEEALALMEDASRRALRPTCIMRSMQIQAPLSASIDPATGEIAWFDNTAGDHILNPPGRILLLDSQEAVRFKFASGIAATKEELTAAMGITEVVWAGDDAARFIDQNIRDAHETEKRWQIKYREFLIYYAYAEQAQNRADLGKFASRALLALRELEALQTANPGLAWNADAGPEWRAEKQEAIRKLLRKNP